ncbi:MAG: ribbon-helix-helix domain-containing protein [Halobacteria archaeon]
MARSIPVKLPDDLVGDMDDLIRKGRFLSRSDLLRFGVRLAVGLERKRLSLHTLAEEYAAEEVQRKLRRRSPRGARGTRAGPG